MLTSDTPDDIKRAYERGLRDGYARGLSDGRMDPADLAKKQEAQRVWVPKRRSDWPTLEGHP